MKYTIELSPEFDLLLQKEQAGRVASVTQVVEELLENGRESPICSCDRRECAEVAEAHYCVQHDPGNNRNPPEACELCRRLESRLDVVESQLDTLLYDDDEEGKARLSREGETARRRLAERRLKAANEENEWLQRELRDAQIRNHRALKEARSCSLLPESLFEVERYRVNAQRIIDLLEGNS